MSLRFRKSIKIMPGVRINVSKSGISTSIGVKGATVNLKPGRKARATVGIPGTGLSYTTTLSSGDKSHEQGALQVPAREGLSSREIRFAVLLYLVLLGCAFATDSWMFATFITVCAIAIFLARRQPKIQQETPDQQ
jgi:hypothetical protein